LDPSSRSSCGTNPSTDLAGLTAVLTRALSLPSSAGVSPATQSQWRSMLGSLPALPLEDSRKVPGQKSVQPLYPGYTPKAHNSENTALYTVHPFRLFGAGKGGLATARATYVDRQFSCNVGWCQDVVDAAMLGLTQDASAMVRERAQATSQYRFSGFAQKYQDYSPSADHFGFMRTSMHYMLLSPLDDTSNGMLLFPAWPVLEWDVEFKLHAPLQTTVEAACTNGTLTRLVVTPPSRRQDFQVLNCANPLHL